MSKVWPEEYFDTYEDDELDEYIDEYIEDERERFRHDFLRLDSDAEEYYGIIHNFPINGTRLA